MTVGHQKGKGTVKAFVKQAFESMALWRLKNRRTRLRDHHSRQPGESPCPLREDYASLKGHCRKFFRPKH
jgi:hypothetical protein